MLYSVKRENQQTRNEMDRTNIPPIPQTNPYIPGKSAGKTSKFVGRDDILLEVKRVLDHPEQCAVVLYGQRRIGKTSILHYLEANLLQQANYYPIFYDLMYKAGKAVDDIVSELAQLITAKLQISDVSKNELHAETFRTNFLPKVIESLPNHTKIVLLFDEFDSLVDPQADRQSKIQFFEYLRDLFQISPQRLKFVFVIGRNVNDWDILIKGLFKEFPSYHVSLLNRHHTELLIRLSEHEGSLFWDDKTIDAIWQLTSGHPFFIQSLCYEIWENAKINGRLGTSVCTEEVEYAVDAVMHSYAHVFEWIWDGLGPIEHATAAALAASHPSVVSANRLHKILTENGIHTIFPNELLETLQRLRELDILTQKDNGYCFHVELLRRWVFVNKPLARVCEEFEHISSEADSLYTSARSMYNTKKLEESIYLLKRALEINPNHRRARYLLIRAYIDKGLLDEAQTQIEKYYPSEEARELLEQVYYSQFQKAQKDRDKLSWLDKIEKLYPNDELSIREKYRLKYLEIGQRSEKNKEFNTALEAYQRIGDEKKTIELRKHIQREISITLHQIKTLKLEKNYELAYRKVVEFQEIYPEEYDWQSELLWLEKALSLQETYNRAIDALEHNEFIRAKYLLTEIISIDPEYEHAAYYLLQIMGENDLDEKLLQLFKNALSYKHDKRSFYVKFWSPLHYLILLFWLFLRPQKVDIFKDPPLLYSYFRLGYLLLLMPVLALSLREIVQGFSPLGFFGLVIYLTIVTYLIIPLITCELNHVEFFLLLVTLLPIASRPIYQNISFIVTFMALLIAVGISAGILSWIKKPLMIVKGKKEVVSFVNSFIVTIPIIAIAIGGGGALEAVISIALPIMIIFIQWLYTISFSNLKEEIKEITLPLTVFTIFTLLYFALTFSLTNRLLGAHWTQSVLSVTIAILLMFFEVLIEHKVKENISKMKKNIWGLAGLGLSWVVLALFSVNGLDFSLIQVSSLPSIWLFRNSP